MFLLKMLNKVARVLQVLTLYDAIVFKIIHEWNIQDITELLRLPKYSLHQPFENLWKFKSFKFSEMALTMSW